MPEEFEAVLLGIDESGEPTTSHAISAALAGARTALRDKIAQGDAWADMIAFQFQEDTSQQGPWHTYFGPMGSSTYENGTVVYSPDPEQLDAEVVDLWASRAQTLTHPVLKARYADLVWELAKHVDGRKRDVNFAKIAADAYVSAVANGLLAERYEMVPAACRALELTLSINDRERVAIARDLLLDLFRRGVADGNRWSEPYRRLTSNKKAGLTDAHKQELVDGLEAIYANTGTGQPGFDPFGQKDAADLLLHHYRKQGSKEDYVRIAKGVSESFEALCAQASGLQAMSWFEDAVEYAELAGDKESANRLKIEREKSIARASDEMKPMTWQTKVSKEDVESFVESLVDEHLGNSLARIANAFVPRVADRRESMKRESPILSMITMQILADDHVMAKVGGVDEDPDGRLFHHASFLMQSDVLWLDKSLEYAVEKHDLDTNILAGFADRNGMFPDIALVKSAIQGWIDGDYVKTVFVLTPQIECALREFVRGLNQAVNKPHPTMPGREIPLNMGDMLSNPIVKEALGEDLTFYFRLVFSDPRGRNFRNRVAHGQIGRGEINYGTANVLIHSMLVMAVIHDIAEARKQEATESHEAIIIEAEADELINAALEASMDDIPAPSIRHERPRRKLREQPVIED
ncbi:DUF4209 domain-containing protein [Agrobacterium tumefaciens]|uniref:DUF4209 domain-containing protein n=1 Tax=Agrobacterium tumefaciens TaxID=358 RepID=UPI0011F39808|nr:DUF4209 domain-containing protein [Agrobacterium tumefaciens]KAA1237156.1 DUF4209 domain-containing protein [Agrobacterium tumefaciens]